MDVVCAEGVVILRPGGILFDMDGVLVSSIGSVERTWKKWSQAHGIDPELALRTAHGRRAIESVKLLRPDLNELQELEWLEEMEIADNVGLEMLAGVRRILEALPGKYWTVVTSATDRLARVRLQHGGIPVPERIVAADTVENGKPHPEPYCRGAEILGVAPEECLVIEDSASGVLAGHAAGCRVLATLFSHAAESLTDADWIVRSLEDVRFALVDESIELEFEPVPRETAVNAAN